MTLWLFPPEVLALAGVVLVFIFLAKSLNDGLSDLSRSSAEQQPWKKEIRVKNLVDKSGEFYVKEAYELRGYGLHARVCDRMCEDNESLLKADTIADLESQIERSYERMPRRRSFFEKKKRRKS